MDWLLIILAPLLLVAVVFWYVRRRRIDQGSTCWNCNADLSDRPIYVDAKGRSRCPTCGNEMDLTDVYKLPPSG